MKISGEYVLTEVDSETVAVPIGSTGESFRGIVKLNDTGVFIWKALTENMSPEQIAESIVENYSDVDYDTALSCTAEMIEKLKNEGIIEDE